MCYNKFMLTMYGNCYDYLVGFHQWLQKCRYDNKCLHVIQLINLNHQLLFVLALADWVRQFLAVFLQVTCLPCYRITIKLFYIYYIIQLHNTLDRLDLQQLHLWCTINFDISCSPIISYHMIHQRIYTQPTSSHCILTGTGRRTSQLYKFFNSIGQSTFKFVHLRNDWKRIEPNVGTFHRARVIYSILANTHVRYHIKQ